MPLSQMLPLWCSCLHLIIDQKHWVSPMCIQSAFHLLSQLPQSEPSTATTNISRPPLRRWGNWGSEGRAGTTPRLSDSNPELLRLHCFSTSHQPLDDTVWNHWRHLYSFPRVTVTNYHTFEIYSLTVQEARSSKSKCLQDSFLWEALMENSSPYLSPNFQWQPAILSIP